MTEVRNRHINQRSNGIFARMGRVGERSEGMAKRPVVHLVQRGLVNPATGEPGKFKKCMEAGGRRAVGRIRHRRAALGTAPACIGP